jgi:hypothetical protein
MGFQLGAVPLALAFFSLAAGRALKRGEARRLIGFAQGLLVVSVFMALAPSAPVWERVSLVRFAQFPWRYFTLAAPALAILSAAALAGVEEEWAERRIGWPAELPAFVLVAALLLNSYPYVRAEIRPPAEGPVSLAGLMRFQRVSDHMTGATIWTSQIPGWSSMADIMVAGGSVTTKVDYSVVPQNRTLAVDSLSLTSIEEKVWVWAGDGQQQVRFYRFYYPGWKAYLLEDKTERLIGELPITTTGPQGLITVPVPQGAHYLILRFEPTLVRRIGELASGLSLAGVLALLILRRALAGALAGGRHA